MREMTLDDVDAVLAIENIAQPHPWTRGNFSDALKCGYHCVVDEIEQEIVSYAVLMPVLDEAELLTIAVAKNQQRKGLGRAILQGQLHWARAQNMRRIFLEVRVTNLSAIALYRSLGFVDIGKRHGYYPSAQGREDALLMACELTGENRG